MRTILVTAFLILSSVLQAQTALRTKHYNTEKGLAVEGYDLVSYFSQNKAIKGDARWTVVDEGITYRFSSESNKNLFLKNPRNYQPQYGGWCAYAMGATGEKVEVDPETFKVLNGKLYLFYHSWTNNTLTKWNKDEAHLRTEADKNWQKTYH